MDTPVDYNHRDKTLRHVTASPLATHGRRQRLRFALYFVGCTHAHCPARRAALARRAPAQVVLMCRFSFGAVRQPEADSEGPLRGVPRGCCGLMSRERGTA